MTHETYTIRDKNGIMIMRIVGNAVQRMFKELDGTWRTYQEKGGRRTVCYEITTDGIWTSETYQGAFQMYLWEGTKIIKD